MTRAMKTSALTSVLLAVSLAANALLAWLLFHRAPEPTPSTLALNAPAHPPSAAPAPTKATTVASARSATDSHAALRDRLLALGLPAEAVRAAIRAVIEAPRRARDRDLRAATPPLPWWQGLHGYRVTLEQENDLRGLRTAEREEMTRLFGRAGALTAAELEPYLFLPPDRAADLAALERDYTDLRFELAQAVPGDPTAAADRRRILENEYTRDLAALLTPEERTALELRTSPTAQKLATRLASFDGTDAEFRAVYDLQKTFDDTFPSTGMTVVLTGAEPRTLAETKLSEDLRAALGADRYAAWQLAQREDYRTLVDLQRRFVLPPATVDALTKFPLETSAASGRIAADPSLNSQQKVDALKALAQETRNQVRTTLGTNLGDAYLASGGAHWLSSLDRGGSFSFTPTGGVTTRSVTNRLPPPK